MDKTLHIFTESTTLEPCVPDHVFEVMHRHSRTGETTPYIRWRFTDEEANRKIDDYGGVSFETIYGPLAQRNATDTGWNVWSTVPPTAEGWDTWESAWTELPHGTRRVGEWTVGAIPDAFIDEEGRWHEHREDVCGIPEFASREQYKSFYRSYVATRGPRVWVSAVKIS